MAIPVQNSFRKPSDFLGRFSEVHIMFRIRKKVIVHVDI